MFQVTKLWGCLFCLHGCKELIDKVKEKVSGPSECVHYCSFSGNFKIKKSKFDWMFYSFYFPVDKKWKPNQFSCMGQETS